MDIRSIFVTKTFILNVVAVAIYVLGQNWGVVIPHAAEILGGLNILLRFLTNGPVTFFGAQR